MSGGSWKSTSATVRWTYSGATPDKFIVYCNDAGTTTVGGGSRSATVNCGVGPGSGSYVQVGVRAVKGSQDSGIQYGNIRG